MSVQRSFLILVWLVCVAGAPSCATKKEAGKSSQDPARSNAGGSGGPPGASGQAARVGDSAAADLSFCEEHRVPEAQCAICLPEVASILRIQEVPASWSGSPLVRLATPEAARKAGLRAVRAAAPARATTVPAYAEVAFDENRFARIACPAGGTVERILVDLGDRVQAGAILATVRSPEIARLRSEARIGRERERLAQIDYERATSLRAEGLVSQRDFQDHEQRLAVARAERIGTERRLQAFGGGEHPDVSGQEQELLPLVSLVDGIVVTRQAVTGQVVDAEETILEVADMGGVWVDLRIAEEDAARIRGGEVVRLSVHAFPGEVFHGTVVAVGSAVDPESRRLRARASVANPDGRLKANLYGLAEIEVGPSPARAVVPREAIQRVEDQPVVFVRLEEDLFEARAVRAGADKGGRTEILAGLLPDEEVVTDGAFLLKTQISKGSIGAGCCDVVETLGRRR